ncbi:uncharacterized protein LOC128851463 isoform X1 [Cuculus canorus]|uniref:uncharacterized protein LOC128851463 isoform X1 n=1 Tax=Cuculus canorus TaxID=55661 RepID=UPI0023AA48F2|nr:uncharacterized protein LOC128851463 isoform X1 [Cuculus canorus]
MTLSVLGKMLEQRDVAIAGPVVVQLSEKLQPLFDNVRLCAPQHEHWMLPGNFAPCSFSARARAGLRQPVLSSCPLPCQQESASIKVLSFKLFRDVMELLVAVDRKATKRQVRRNLLPLLFHVYDENQPVAEVRILALLGFPWEVAGLPPAPVPHEAQGSRFLLASAPEQQLWEPSLLPPGSTGCPRWRLPQCSARAAKPPADAFPSCCPFPAGPKKDPQPCPGEGMRVLCPGQRCHLPVSAALQASRETLLQATELLKLRKLRKKLKSGQIYKLGKCLVRMAPRWQRQAGQGPAPVPGVWGCQLCPCPLPQPIAPGLHPAQPPFPRPCSPAGPSPGSCPSPSPGVPMEAWLCGALAAGWLRSSPGSTSPALPAKHWLAAGWERWVSWRERPVLGTGAARPRRGSCADLSPCPLALSPAGRGQEQKRRLPVPGPAVPAEPPGVPARGGRRVFWAPWSEREGTAGRAADHLPGPRMHDKRHQPIRLRLSS